ncbi:hypothetical protein H5410_050365 [Solanum commersonii]|uniref:Uncharacterized protein n=1 Tax=Solanum commersonii TaxID=4109 RepID=A0A9J5WVB1_SOLCO|nr:hypothetical protein H5410_050365 [Solanum commersonii]
MSTRLIKQARTENEKQERLQLSNIARKPREFRRIPQPQTRTKVDILGGKGWEILKWGKEGWDDCYKVWAILRISRRICWDFCVKKKTRMGSGVGLVLLFRLLGCRRKGEEEMKLGRLYEVGWKMQKWAADFGPTKKRS